eukprot:9387523-Alexandrium_andersonii.AAC.1
MRSTAPTRARRQIAGAWATSKRDRWYCRAARLTAGRMSAAAKCRPPRLPSTRAIDGLPSPLRSTGAGRGGA